MENVQVKFSSPKNPLPDENQNQNHNTRKESLGPNTKRQEEPDTTKPGSIELGFVISLLIEPGFVGAKGIPIQQQKTKRLLACIGQQYGDTFI